MPFQRPRYTRPKLPAPSSSPAGRWQTPKHQNNASVGSGSSLAQCVALRSNFVPSMSGSRRSGIRVGYCFL
jgi:hypothetical protein